MILRIDTIGARDRRAQCQRQALLFAGPSERQTSSKRRARAAKSYAIKKPKQKKKGEADEHKKIAQHDIVTPAKR